MIYLIVGDVHGQYYPMLTWINTLAGRGLTFDEVIQVGDFGVYPNHTINLLEKLNENGHHVNHKIHFVDGNHENHGYLVSQAVDELANFNIEYHPRGSVTYLEDGTTIGWLGGAFNVERSQEIWNLDNGQSITNFPSKLEIDTAIDTFNAVGKSLDLLVTHVNPCNLGIGIKGQPIFNQTIEMYIGDLGYAIPPITDVGDEPLLTLYHGLNHGPDNWVFGHLHQHHYAKVGKTNFYCVGCCDGGNVKPRIYLYDSELKQVLI